MVRIRKPDASLAGLAGAGVVNELVGARVVPALDRAVGPIKQRERALTGGQLLVGLATGQSCGQDSLSRLDRVRADPASALLTLAPVPASTTCAQLAARFGPAQLAGFEAGLSAVYSRWLGLLPAQLRGALVLTCTTIDLDATDIKVFEHARQRIGWNYAGQVRPRLPGVVGWCGPAVGDGPAGW